MEPENKVSLYGKIRLASIFLPPGVLKNASKKKKKKKKQDSWDKKQVPG